MLKTNHMDFYQTFQKLQKHQPKGGGIFFVFVCVCVLFACFSGILYRGLERKYFFK